MPLDNTARDVEAKTGSLPDILGGEERIEDAIDNLRWNPRPVVNHADHDLAVRGFGHDLDMAARRRVDRVVQQIRPHLIQLTAVTLHLWQIWRDLQIDGDRVRLRLGPQYGDGVGEPAANGHRLARRLLVDEGEALPRVNQRVNARGRDVDLRCQLANRQLPGDMSEDDPDPLRAHESQHSIEIFDAKARGRQRLDVDIGVRMGGQPVLDGILTIG